jgi:calcium-dependent protein kinase
MAPEVALSKAYDQKCDIWSAGVILYLAMVCLTLSGFLPFNGQNYKEVKEKIIKGHYEFKCNLCITIAPRWERISNDAKDLVSQLLQYTPERRLSAFEALQHPWIRRFTNTVTPNESILAGLENLRCFRTQMTLQKAVLSYIASQELSKEEEERIKELFDSINVERNGRISKEELVKSYMGFGVSEEIAISEV